MAKEISNRQIMRLMERQPFLGIMIFILATGFMLVLMNLYIQYVEPKMINVGTEGKLIVRGADFVLLADTAETFDDAQDTKDAGNYVGYLQIMTNNGFAVEEGTKAVVEGSAVGKFEVKVLEGNYQGRIGWIPQEWIALS